MIATLKINVRSFLFVVLNKVKNGKKRTSAEFGEKFTTKIEKLTVLSAYTGVYRARAQLMRSEIDKLRQKETMESTKMPIWALNLTN